MDSASYSPSRIITVMMREAIQESTPGQTLQRSCYKLRFTYF